MGLKKKRHNELEISSLIEIIGSEHTYIHSYIHTYIHTYIYIYIYIYIYTSSDITMYTVFDDIPTYLHLLLYYGVRLG